MLLVPAGSFPAWQEKSCLKRVSYFKMGIWTHIHLEAFCMFSHNSKKKLETINLKTNKKRIIENNHYISKDKRPSWCKKFNRRFLPQYRCFSCKCPFFAHVNADKKDYKIFDKAYDKSVEKEETIKTS